MEKRLILITGTPCVGKTTLARKLAAELKAEYINLTELAEKERLILGRDATRSTNIVDEVKMRSQLKAMLKDAATDVVIDGHYAAAVAPKRGVSYVFVLRRNPVELREFMRRCGFSQPKEDENLAAEILDVCLVEALRNHPRGNVCELDLTGKTVEETLKEVLNILSGKRACSAGYVDWLGMLESQGKLDEYLKS